MHMGIPICELFSDPHTFAYRDLHMHTVIPVWEITHMGIQDLISHMEIFPVCIRLVTDIFPYAYGDCTNPHMHTGIMCHAIPVCIQSLRSLYAYGDWFWSLYAYRDHAWHAIPYAYGDSLDPRMQTGIDLDPRMHTVISCHAICFGCGMCMLCIRKILVHCATHVKMLIQCVTRGKIADTSETDPRTHTGSPSRKICIWGVPVQDIDKGV